ncbi:hypothetical protein [Kitasatospora purpeofusca]|uniref:hypothetical protein n=1 Tax=Kitasatospora purpeofusca TaxID=67352 RepID=UPI0036465ABB
MNFPIPMASQATQVEQSRAEAEVKAAVLVAQQCPRNIESARQAMLFSCQQMALAERAFYSYPRAGETVTGPSIHLARELALVWGNLQHSVVELSRDDGAGRSEILAYAWDLQTNARSSQIFISPHRRDTKRGAKDLTDLRDVYENNANMGARRLREAIFAVLPTWFREEALATCRETLKRGTGTPLPERIREAVAAYGQRGVVQRQLEDKVGRPSDRWTEDDVTELDILFRSINRGEIKRDEAFPPVRVTVAEVTRRADFPPSEDGQLPHEWTDEQVSWLKASGAVQTEPQPTAEQAAWPQVAQAGGAE